MKKNISTHTLSLKPWQKATLVFLLLVGIWFKAYWNTRTESIQYAWPPHFNYYGSTYISRGHYVWTLPEGYELAGETIDVGNSYERNELEGNVSGYVYVNQKDCETVYFQDKHWEEATDGMQRYWSYIRKE